MGVVGRACRSTAAACADATRGDFRRQLVESLYHAMLNARLAELGQDPAATITGAGSNTSALTRTCDGFSRGAGAKDGRVGDALALLFREIARVEKFGFLPSELERSVSEARHVGSQHAITPVPRPPLGMRDCDDIDVGRYDDVHHAVGEPRHLRGANVGFVEHRVSKREFGDQHQRALDSACEPLPSAGILFVVVPNIGGQLTRRLRSEDITSRGSASRRSMGCRRRRHELAAPDA
jgi:hypothetical protein